MPTRDNSGVESQRWGHLSWVPTGEDEEVTTMTLTMDTPKQMIRNDEDVLPAVPENHVNNMLGKMVGP